MNAVDAKAHEGKPGSMQAREPRIATRVEP